MKVIVHPDLADEKAKPVSDVEVVPLRRLVAYFLRLGTVRFGGPIALVGYMHRDLVGDRKWVSNDDYLEGLAFSQLSPGPLAAQLANYLGWVHSGTLGATLAGIAFVLPSLLMVMVLAAMYVHFGQLTWIQGAFYGIGAAVSAVIARSAWRLIRKTLGKDHLLWIVFAILMITTVWTESEILWLFILSGFVSMTIKAPLASHTNRSRAVCIPLSLARLLAPVGTKSLTTVFLFFLKAGAFVFGSGLAIVPFLYGGVVGDSLADRATVPGRRRSRDDYARTCRHYFRFHRLSGGWSFWSLGRDSRSLSSALSVGSYRGTVLPAIRKES